ncbi:hypothetical protein [Klebsiella michiganensis]|uniref:hypothetical protein n=1 Tax=Klebsiella michiganensis TaxID=1134687 RepID=UPI0016695718|nr:hypothetical protein [Klebsiella michiganensis]MBD0984594.1 hypothetical protein [Klebsiella michiganensis]
MPKVSNEQKAVMDILDLIHFHNVYTSRLISSEDQNLFQDIALDVQGAVNKISTEEALLDILTHYLICGLEISLSGDDVKFMSKLKGKYEIPDEVLDSILKKKKEISFALLSCMVSEHGIKKADFIDQLVNLTKKYEGIYIPATIAYRLANNFNSLVHPLDHLHFYGYLNDIGVMTCAKYRCNKKNDNKDSFNRIALLMEFEILRVFARFCIDPGGMDEITLKLPPKDIPDELRKKIIDEYKYFIENVVNTEGIIYKFTGSNLNEEKTALLLLKNVSLFFKRKRIFEGTIARWPGAWGAFLMELLRQEDSRRAIYCENDNSNCVSEEASEIMSNFNFKVSARTLYLRYNSFKRKELKLINDYRYLLSQAPYTPSWDGESYLYKIISP